MIMTMMTKKMMAMKLMHYAGAGAGALSASSLAARLTDTASPRLELYNVNPAVYCTIQPPYLGIVRNV